MKLRSWAQSMKSPRFRLVFCVRSTQTRLRKIEKKKPQKRRLAPPRDLVLDGHVLASLLLRRNPGNRKKDSDRINASCSVSMRSSTAFNGWSVGFCAQFPRLAPG